MPAWFFASLRGYRIELLLRDSVAGITLAAIAIPGQLATARLGMPPETGLYAFAAGSIDRHAGDNFLGVKRRSVEGNRWPIKIRC